MHIWLRFVAKNKKYGLNICGEGGEYETFTLDCPLFKKKIVMYVWSFLFICVEWTEVGKIVEVNEFIVAEWCIHLCSQLSDVC